MKAKWKTDRDQVEGKRHLLDIQEGNYRETTIHDGQDLLAHQFPLQPLFFSRIVRPLTFPIDLQQQNQDELLQHSWIALVLYLR